MGTVIGIHHVCIKAKGIGEFEKAVSFYKNVLGLPVAREWSKGDNDKAIMLDTGAGFIEIFSNAPDILSMGAVRHFALDVKDVDACASAVRNAGYRIITEPVDIVIPSDPPCPARIAFCVGPLGEEIELFERKS